jgi:hypothetical protein
MTQQLLTYLFKDLKIRKVGVAPERVDRCEVLEPLATIDLVSLCQFIELNLRQYLVAAAKCRI